MVLLWLAFQRERLVRISGLRYLRALLQEPAFQAPGNSFWVMPTVEDAAANRAWLNTQGFNIGESDCYVAPHYARTGPLEDPALLALLEAKRPQYVLINLGGGVQERLGYYLREALKEKQGAVNQEPGGFDPQVSGLFASVSQGENRGQTPGGQQPATARFQVSARAYCPALICTGAAIALT